MACAWFLEKDAALSQEGWGPETGMGWEVLEAGQQGSVQGSLQHSPLPPPPRGLQRDVTASMPLYLLASCSCC